MATPATERSPNQKIRTRKALLQAAAELTRRGLKPNLEEIAEAALVSRATAYRYFPKVETLLLEASFDIDVPEPRQLFGADSSGDAVSRMERVDSAVHEVIVENEAALRMMLAHSMERRVRGDDGEDVPSRQNRRMPLIDAALAPARRQFTPSSLDMLRKALALIVGPEAVFIFKDVLQLSDADARKVKRWAIRALVEAATRN